MKSLLGFVICCFGFFAGAKCMESKAVKGPFKVVSVVVAQLKCDSGAMASTAISIIKVRKGKKTYSIAEPTTGVGSFKVGKTVRGEFKSPCCDYTVPVKCGADGKILDSEVASNLEIVACRNQADGLFESP